MQRRRDTNFPSAGERAERKQLNTIKYIHPAACGAASCGCVLSSPDPRTDPWPLVYSPVPVTLVFTSYLLLVALGPSCMRQRRRLELRALLLTYNLAMVALSSYMFYEVRRGIGSELSTWQGFQFQSFQIPGFEQFLLKGVGAGWALSLFCHKRSSVVPLYSISSRFSLLLRLTRDFIHPEWMNCTVRSPHQAQSAWRMWNGLILPRVWLVLDPSLRMRSTGLVGEGGGI